MNKEIEKDISEAKKRFIKELILIVSDLDKKIRIKVDILNYATDRVLSIECKDRRWKLVVFISKSLNKTKKNIRFMIKRC